MLSCEAAMLAQFGGTTNSVGLGFGVFFLFAFVTFYGSCVDAISYVYCAEIFPTSLRAEGVSFSIVGLFLMNLSKKFLLSTCHYLFYLLCQTQHHN